MKTREPERFDVLDALPGEEAQVDFGLGRRRDCTNGKYRRPYLFVMTLKYSGKSFRKVVWKADQETWARLHEEAFRAFGGSVAYVVLDNLKQGVIEPDLYEPQLQPTVCRDARPLLARSPTLRASWTPIARVSVENAIQHTQSTALKGTKFESIEAQNVWLAHWEERWAAPRIHGRKKRQVLAMFAEEKPDAEAAAGDRASATSAETSHTVDDARSGAGPARRITRRCRHRCMRVVTVRIYEREIEILDCTRQLLRRHEKFVHTRALRDAGIDRIFNPSRETAACSAKSPRSVRTACSSAREIFARLGRPGQKAIYGLSNLRAAMRSEDIERAASRCSALTQPSYHALKRILEHHAPSKTRALPPASPSCNRGPTHPRYRGIPRLLRERTHAL